MFPRFRPSNSNPSKPFFTNAWRETTEALQDGRRFFAGGRFRFKALRDVDCSFCTPGPSGEHHFRTWCSQVPCDILWWEILDFMGSTVEFMGSTVSTWGSNGIYSWHMAFTVICDSLGHQDLPKGTLKGISNPEIRQNLQKDAIELPRCLANDSKSTQYGIWFWTFKYISMRQNMNSKRWIRNTIENLDNIIYIYIYITYCNIYIYIDFWPISPSAGLDSWSLVSNDRPC